MHPNVEKGMDHACTSVQSLDLSYRFSHDNLHIRVNRHFNLAQAGILISLLRHYRQNCKRIFIDVRDVTAPDEAAASAWKLSFLHTDISPERIIFKGKTGFALAVSGNRVLLVPEKSLFAAATAPSVLASSKRPADPGPPRAITACPVLSWAIGRPGFLTSLFSWQGQAFSFQRQQQGRLLLCRGERNATGKASTLFFLNNTASSFSRCVGEADEKGLIPLHCDKKYCTAARWPVLQE